MSLALSICAIAMASKLDRRAAPVTHLQLVTSFTNGLKQHIKSNFYANPVPDFEMAALKARGLKTGLASDAAASTLNRILHMRSWVTSPYSALTTWTLHHVQTAMVSTSEVIHHHRA